MVPEPTPPFTDTATGPPAREATGRREPPRFLRLKRTGLLIATTLIAVNVWTGAPVMALWVGSRVVGHRSLSMAAVFVVVASLAVLIAAMTLALTWLGARYDDLVERPPGGRRIAPWLRSMRGERDDLIAQRRGTTAMEVIVLASTIIAVLSLEVWFFFFAGSSLPS